MHRLCRKEFLTAPVYQDVTHGLATNTEGVSNFDVGKFESKLTPKHVEELIGK